MKPSAQCHIRFAGAGDLPTLQHLGHETYYQHFAALWSEQGIRRFLAQDFAAESLTSSLQPDSGSAWFLAEDERGAAIGFARVNWDKPLPLSTRRGAELQKIYFLPAATGRGCGERLMREIMQAATARRKTLIWLDVLNSNLDAQRFYARQGFQPLGQIPYRTDKVDIGMTVMAHELSE
ncbi:GNAT family N-acetyltransferase [Affinibrenneria salicis]|uniref:GNAT family N-acetyltransferase n=1 Tax=Affinibrenneria salicis TaxID=2590031 RepID=UPI001CC78AE9|nr:GNAT family N-acetyltransferase [Affinibrenneria salicis]